MRKRVVDPNAKKGRPMTFNHKAAVRMFCRPKVFNAGGQHSLYTMSDIARAFNVTPTTIKHVVDEWLLENGMTHRFSTPIDQTTYRGETLAISSPAISSPAKDK